jgi:hypothetical protein
MLFLSAFLIRAVTANIDMGNSSEDSVALLQSTNAAQKQKVTGITTRFLMGKACPYLVQKVLAKGSSWLLCGELDVEGLGICAAIDVEDAQLLTPFCEAAVVAACKTIVSKVTSAVVTKIKAGSETVEQACTYAGLPEMPDVVPCMKAGALMQRRRFAGRMCSCRRREVGQTSYSWGKGFTCSSKGNEAENIMVPTR